ncbi:MTH1187 family thiamine-binding protein [Carboxylicivirga linearis]|uniref:MTH1187 family thiamine-binding protein n=1 Tax=Carboxylicivirga linearis TaxID=1628157 RepID=A0ABS5K175_9BACT|nr:MTH1187 family thiamine-binding protein [Carboxylicivirga linearis]MBS2100805.1 MTH1187 family thiamine-binding protein [Carboxylicivirga linearis]
MSVMLNFAMFPTDKGDSVSKYVSKVIKNIDASGVEYKLNPMGTTIETATMQEALAIVQQSYDILEEFSDRVYCSINIDARKGKDNRMKGKINSIETHIGEVKK